MQKISEKIVQKNSVEIVKKWVTISRRTKMKREIILKGTVFLTVSVLLHVGRENTMKGMNLYMKYDDRLIH